MGTIDQELKSRFQSPQQRALVHLLFAANQVKHQQAALIRPLGLSIEQYNILRILRGAKGEKISMQQINSRMIDRSPNTTRLMDKLIAKGSVARTRCEEDRRVVYVNITVHGLELLKKADDLLSPTLEKLGSGFSKKQAVQLNELLEQFRDSLIVREDLAGSILKNNKNKNEK